MKIFYSDTHRKHQPPFEVFDGGKRVPYLENADRMDRILTALEKTDWAELTSPTDFGLDPILAVHDKDYINFLSSCWTEWLALDPTVAASPEQNAFLPATFALRRKPRVPSTLLGKAGYYIMDLSACIVEGTYEAALSSVNCALSAAEYIARSQSSTFALCRPPGHHAGKDYAGGYCFINNSSVAASWLSSKGRVAILDIDYHAGNGTQDIFYERKDVLTIKEEKALYDTLLQRVVALGERAFAPSPGEAAVYLDGTSNILSLPEFEDLERMRALFRTFEEKGRLVRILNACIAGDGIRVLIGHENPDPELRDLSLVTASCDVDGAPGVGLGVLGSTRMEYAHVVSLVDHGPRRLRNPEGEALVSNKGNGPDDDLPVVAPAAPPGEDGLAPRRYFPGAAL